MVILDFGLKNCPVIRQTAKDPGIFLSKNAVQNMYSHFPPFFQIFCYLSVLYTLSYLKALASLQNLWAKSDYTFAFSIAPVHGSAPKYDATTKFLPSTIPSINHRTSLQPQFIDGTKCRWSKFHHIVVRLFVSKEIGDEEPYYSTRILIFSFIWASTI